MTILALPAATRAGEIAYVCHYTHFLGVNLFLGGAYARTPYNPRAFLSLGGRTRFAQTCGRPSVIYEL